MTEITTQAFCLLSCRSSWTNVNRNPWANEPSPECVPYPAWRPHSHGDARQASLPGPWKRSRLVKKIDQHLFILGNSALVWIKSFPCQFQGGCKPDTGPSWIKPRITSWPAQQGLRHVPKGIKLPLRQALTQMFQRPNRSKGHQQVHRMCINSRWNILFHKSQWRPLFPCPGQGWKTKWRGQCQDWNQNTYGRRCCRWQISLLSHGAGSNESVLEKVFLSL